MQNLPKIGLPIIFAIALALIIISKAAVTIGPEKAEYYSNVLEMVLILKRPMAKVSILLLHGTLC